MVKIYTQKKKTGFESMILTHIHMEDQWQDGEQRWEKNKQHKRANVDTNRKDTCLMKYKVLKKSRQNERL